MTKDHWIGLAVIAFAIYLWGIANRGWPTPLRPLSRVLRWMSGLDGSGHENPWSDDEDMSEEDTDDVSGPDTRRVPADALAGPRALDELRAEAGLDDEPVDLDGIPVPTDRSPTARRRWLRARMRPGDEIAATRTATELDALAAELFAVDDRTIRRDRAYLRREQ